MEELNRDFINSSSTKDNTINKDTPNAAKSVVQRRASPKDSEVVMANPAKPASRKKNKPSLSTSSKESVVPSSRIGRLVSFGSLAAGLGVGAVAQYVRNAVHSMKGNTEGVAMPEAFMSPANAERIVNTLCKVRGAALKLGQQLSLQDEYTMTPEMQRIFERVRQSADFMPAWQVDQVLASQLGPEWRSRLQSFEYKPFAAASIGQVHRAVLPDGREVAMKLQYPGVARGIESDLDNLVGVLKVWNIFPKGMFIDNVVEVAKRELAWEVDYVREAACTKRFKLLLQPYPEYYVPNVIEELCTAGVMTTELVEGLPLDQLENSDEAIRHQVAASVMHLCLREMFVLRCMQTDPNWANFLYDSNTRRIILLDFGATRTYPKQFMDQYIEMIRAASLGDRARILRPSENLGFLTGNESEVMREAHADAVMIMGEVFAGPFDFGAQSTTRRARDLAPTLLAHRQRPPPEEAYSLHRKLAGVFLLCARLKVRIDCREMFDDVYQQYSTGS